jgi:ribonuclease HIII
MSHCFVTTIDPSYAKKIHTYLIERGCVISTPPFTLFSAKGKGFSCTFYLSGKFTVQGKDKDEFIQFYLEPEILNTFSPEGGKKNLLMTARIGCDEAGKGDFFGPLCVASFYFAPSQANFLLSLGVADSKTLTDSKIHHIATELKKSCAYEIVLIFPKKYNQLYEKFQNLNTLLGWAHVKAMTELSKKVDCNDVLLDQFVKPPFMQSLLNRTGNTHIKLTERTKGEEDIAVACASILARDAFVEGLEKLSKEVGMTLPKGASKQVILGGKKLLSTYGRGKLEEVSKLHFKTYRDLFI